MAIALEAVDLVAICAILLLIGLLMATAYTFERLAGALDVDVLGFRPFAGVASAIRSYIVAGLNDGIDALEDVAVTLWRGVTWSLGITIDGIHDFVGGVDRLWKWTSGSGLVGVVSALLEPLRADVRAAAKAADDAGQAVATLGINLERELGRTATATLGTANRDAANLFSAANTYADKAARLAAAGVQADVAAMVAGAEAAGGVAVEQLRAAEQAAIEAATAADNATAGELRDLLGTLTPVDAATALAAVPVLRAVVQTLEAETGLGNPGCRGKVKGICGTDPSRWLHFLEGLAVAIAWPGLEEFAEGVADAAPLVIAAVQDLAGVAG